LLALHACIVTDCAAEAAILAATAMLASKYFSLPLPQTGHPVSVA